MNSYSIAQVPQRRSLDARTFNRQPSAHPISSNPTFPPSPLSNRRSAPTMRANGDSFSANQYVKSDRRDKDVPVGPAIFSSGLPATMRITSSNYGSASFSTPFRSGRQHLSQQTTGRHADSAPSSAQINLPYRSSSHRAPAASGYSEEGINGLGGNSDGDSDDIDDASCVLFETTINGDNCMQRETVSRYGESSNRGFPLETKISLPSTRTTGDRNPVDDEDEGDANIFDSFIPVYGRPTAAPPALARCATPQSHLQTTATPSLQTFGIPELVSDVSARLIRFSLLPAHCLPDISPIGQIGVCVEFFLTSHVCFLYTRYAGLATPVCFYHKF